MATADQVRFPGFQFPTTTPVPDEVFDVLMPQLSGAELKVLLYICRRTFGFKKASDSISLYQIAHGITTRDGRVLDGGTGLCKRHVIRALKVLENKNIIKVTRKVDETGLHEVNTYSLNMCETGRGVGEKCPYGSDKISPGVVTAESPRVVTPVSPTTNSNQETVKQETDVVDVAQDLENFGIAKSAATRLVQSYPTQYIKEKLAMSQGLVASGSALVSQNPAGWLRCAIEEDYSPPRTYERHQQRSIKEKKDTKLAQAEAKEQYIPKEVSQQARNVFTEKKEPEKPSRENQKIWELVLGKVKEAFPQGGSETRLTETTLIQITDTAARICVSDRFAGAWLERRMYREIRNALKGVLGKDLDLQFVPVS